VSKVILGPNLERIALTHVRAFAFALRSLRLGVKLFLMREQFIQAIKTNQPAFGLNMNVETIERLADYYELVQKHNPVLHLVGPCTPEEFAVRHVLESLELLEHLPQKALFADVGTGAGLPSIPCLLVRADLKAVLIESKEKKAGFLENTVNALGISDRAAIVNRQFTEAEPLGAEYITCRALDRFVEVLPKLIRWGKGRPLLLFGGPVLQTALEKNGIEFGSRLMPLSEQRFLFVTS
jgi:16S rRNA (guanine527-N7)-methyltransferase